MFGGYVIIPCQTTSTHPINMIIDTPSQIAEFRLRSLRSALKLEILGMTRKGPSVYSILKKEGYKGSKQAVLEQLNAKLG